MSTEKTYAKATEKIEKARNFLLSNQAPLCVFVGLLGFILSVIILVGHTGDRRVFGSMTMDNKTKLVDSLISKRILFLKQADSVKNNEISMLLKTRQNEEQVLKEQLQPLIAQRKILAKAMDRSRKELSDLRYKNGDTSMAYYAQYLCVKRKVLFNAIQSNRDWQNNTIKYVPVSLVDTCRLVDGEKVNFEDRLKLVHLDTKTLQFITDYPSFGFWIVLSIAQMMLWFLMFPMMLGNLVSLKKDLGSKYYKIKWPSIIVNISLPIIFVGVFCFSFYLLLTDDYIILDHYFMKSYNLRMLFYAIPGYLLSIYSFISYLTLAKQFQAMDEDAEKNPDLLKEKVFRERFLQLKQVFNTTFFCSAVVLTLLIVWISAIIYSLNNTEVFLFYKEVSGKDFIPGDYVYLMGLFHTIVLLAFYMPVKFQFGTMKITQPDALREDEASSTKKILPRFLDSLGGVVTASSPLIATLLPGMLDILFP